MNDDLEKLYRSHIIRRKFKSAYSIRCKKGLWGVTGPDQASVEQEARMYFWLYWNDGEYNEKRPPL